ncbi:SPOR domain-containing protein [Ponticaulis sp.]|uniref:SPOR domain-containing protein n=1 Tax=Ponticaulis sp. TaxID=2020902 RepID=UPI0026294909|nr:SPOR domain-containing protein [Ponticaulis sp.]MDF1681400.1 SPOR domain-containing protein [Ponticaulis sp.]
MADDYEAETGPRERSTYSAFGDEYKGFDAREDDGGGKGPLIVILAAGVVLVFGAVVWNAYRQGIRTNPNDAPIFAADDDPYKTRMEEEGDDGVSEANMRLFDSIDNNDRSSDAEVTEVSGSPPDGEPRELRPGAARTGSTTQPSTSTATPPSNTAPVREEPRAASHEPTSTTTPTATPTPTVVPPRPLPPVTNDVPDSSNSVFDANGNYLVQVMALRDRSDAETAWAQLREAHSDLFAGAVMDIQRADLGSRGIFYRLRVAAFATRDDADQFCNALQTRNQSCIVITR